MADTVLVIAAHPDDEILGCGGAMAGHIDDGDSVHTAIMAEGITSRDDKRDRSKRQNELARLHEAVHKANAILGVTDITLFDFPDNRMDGLERLDVIKVVESLIEKVNPDIIYTHHRGDVNVDHGVVHDAVVTACRPLPGHKYPHTLLFFEVPSSTEWQPPDTSAPFVPGWFTDISSALDRKLKALSEYGSEMCPWPHPRSLRAVEHLARWRGATIGVDAAEAFMLGRRLNFRP
ncbi:MAG: PIG-L family deacetylase [FCB group bacterium]|nr:PIG-L family deacetylase [FCB group bacterium]